MALVTAAEAGSSWARSILLLRPPPPGGCLSHVHPGAGPRSDFLAAAAACVHATGGPRSCAGSASAGGGAAAVQG